MLLGIQRMELPSWAFRGASIRDRGRVAANAPRNIYELLADAAAVHHFTGVTSCIGLHLPADLAHDHTDVTRHAAELGLTISSVSATVSSRDGSIAQLAHPDSWVRRRAIEYLSRCASLAGEIGSPRLVVRIIDDSDYPGWREFTARRQRIQEVLIAVAERLLPDTDLVLDFSAISRIRAAERPATPTGIRRCGIVNR